MTPEELEELREKHFGGDEAEEDDREEFEAKFHPRVLHGRVPWWEA